MRAALLQLVSAGVEAGVLARAGAEELISTIVMVLKNNVISTVKGINSEADNVLNAVSTAWSRERLAWRRYASDENADE